MVLASVIAGASGGALANVALSPLGGGAGMLQSYWYGAGLILGERDMYTFHWEKIKKRLESGEDYLSVLEGEMNPAITAIANFSLKIMKDTSQIYLREGVDFMAKLIENMLMLLAGETPNIPADAPTIGDPRRPTGDEPEPTPTPTVDCPAGFRWSVSAQQCVPDVIDEPTGKGAPELNTKNQKYIVSPNTYAIGRLFKSGSTNSNLWALQKNLASGTPNGNWRGQNSGTFQDMEAQGNARWPRSKGFFFFYKGLIIYWAKDLS